MVDKKVPTKATLQKENEELRASLEKMTHARASVGTIAAFGDATTKVGVRNVSNNTVGVPITIPGEPPVTLNAALGGQDPNSVAVISYASWLQVRSSRLVRDGLIVRDDSILGDQFVAGPTDRDDQLPEGARYNVIEDPTFWIESRKEDEIREGLALITSDDTLRRLQNAVTLKLKEVEAKYPSTMGNMERVRKSYQDLPLIFQLVDKTTAERLEHPM